MTSEPEFRTIVRDVTQMTVPPLVTKFFFKEKVERVKVHGTFTRGGLLKSYSWHLRTCGVPRFSTFDLDKVTTLFHLFVHNSVPILC